MVILMFWLICGFLSAMIASGKNHDGCMWFLGGILFGPLALIATLGISDRKREDDTQTIIEQQAEMIKELRRQSGRQLPPRPSSPPPARRYGPDGRRRD